MHTYAASFGDDLAHDLIAANTSEEDIILDPFTGSSTTLIQARNLGRSAIGIDVDPIACLIAEVVTGDYTIEELEGQLKYVDEKIKDIELLAINILYKEGKVKSGAKININGHTILLPNENEIEYWFSPIQMAVLAALTDMSRNIEHDKHRKLVNISISSAIVHKWPNTISLAKDIDHSRPHRVSRSDISIKSQLEIFQRSYRNVIRNLKSINSKTNSGVTYRVIEGDAHDKINSLEENSIDYVLTSPPYFDAIDYPRAHKFSEWWLWPNKEHVKNDKYIGLKAGGEEKGNPYCESINELIPYNVSAILPLQNISGPMFRKLCLYISDMNEVISGLNKIMKERAVLNLVIANNVVRNVKVPVVNIIKELLQKNEFENIESIERKIQENRRRYPYGIKGFSGLMNVEYIINCRKPNRSNKLAVFKTRDRS